MRACGTGTDEIGTGCSRRPSLSVGDIHAQILPPSTHTAHDLLGDVLPPSQRRQLTVHDLPRQVVRERILRANLLAILWCGAQRRIKSFDEKAVVHGVGDSGHLSVQWIFRIRGDVEVNGGAVEAGCGSTRTRWRPTRRARPRVFETGRWDSWLNDRWSWSGAKNVRSLRGTTKRHRTFRSIVRHGAGGS